eukprot:TRINITY_DN2470_c1_g3_i1.p1 TRINITY_DN2470_c1_g3~~TRINITY_DN2470_c1_g3_i1.p1  ORF type:complete len:772 (+),score=193.15 TRINITY_DN2470_c1_g3_i1:73-2316(+)
MAVSLTCIKSFNNDHARTNYIFVNPRDFAVLSAGCTTFDHGKYTGIYASIKGPVYTIVGDDNYVLGTFGASGIQRRTISLSLKEATNITPYQVNSSAPELYLTSLTVKIDFASRNAREQEIDCDRLSKVFKSSFEGQFCNLEQQLLMDFDGTNFVLTILGLETFKMGESGDKVKEAFTLRGILSDKTDLLFEKDRKSTIKLKGASSSSGGGRIFKPNWNFESMGIGGLDQEFGKIFQFAFASRMFPTHVLEAMGQDHAKGILLFGPPGTGKTLMARQIGKMLNGKEPKVCNGPEILSKYVGEAEANIRALFADAETEFKERGEESDLHIIIFDEFDAVARERGTTSGGTGVEDRIVNQLLTKIEGVDALNNILIIGMTNRKDLIDPALLRAGRLEIHVEIGLPDEFGRNQILNIHTAAMRENNYFEGEIDLKSLAARTKNFTGAELKTLVKRAASYAFNRHVNVANVHQPKDATAVRVRAEDFELALTQISPGFGVSSAEFDGIIQNGIIPFGEEMKKLLHAGKSFVEQVRNSDRTPMVSILLEGPVGSGKSAIATKLAIDSGFPFAKLVQPKSLVKFTEQGKVGKIQSSFEDAYKSPLSIVVIDDIERLIEYVPIGPRFSNHVLQALLVMMKSPPPPGHRLLVIGTTSNISVLEDMDMVSQAFNAVLHVPAVEAGAEAKVVLDELDIFESEKDLEAASQFLYDCVPVKKLLMMAEMAKQDTESGSLLDKFMICANEYSARDRRGLK